MFYCLFVLNYPNISLADYISVVFYVYVTNYRQTLKQKKMAGTTPLSPSYLHWNILSGKGIKNLNVYEHVFIKRKMFNYIEFVHKYFPADLPGRGLAWAESKSSAQALLYPERWWWNTDVDRAEPDMDPVGHGQNNFRSTFWWFVTNVM